MVRCYQVPRRLVAFDIVYHCHQVQRKLSSLPKMVSTMRVIVIGFRIVRFHSMDFFNHSFEVVDYCCLTNELYDVVVALSRSLRCGRSVLTIDNPLFLSSGRNMGSIVVEFSRAIRIASLKRLCGRRIKVRGIDGTAGCCDVLQLGVR